MRFRDLKISVELPRKTLDTTFHCLELELSIAYTCIQLSRSWLLLGNLAAAADKPAEATKAIEFVRSVIVDFGGGVEQQLKNEFLNRCDNLENELRLIKSRSSG
jgi:hypothetical protein